MNIKTVLVRSYPSEPLIRQIFDEKNDYVLVWRGDNSNTDYPAPCPKEYVFEVDLALKEKIELAVRKHGAKDYKVDSLWRMARPVYNG